MAINIFLCSLLIIRNYLGVSLIFIVCLSKAFALDLELTQGINASLPIGIYFYNSPVGKNLNAIISHDLSFSSRFTVIAESTLTSPPSIIRWRELKADSALIGLARQIGYNRYAIHYELIDVAAGGNILLTKDYQINGQELRSLAHHISDEVYQRLTGERGIFSTKIAYVLAEHHGETSKYSLEVADVDGFNPQSLLTSSEPLMSPTWSPDGRQIAYVSFEKKKAQIFTIEVASGRRRLVTSFTGINGAPAWSPNGRELAVVLSKDGSPKVYCVDLQTGKMKQLTFGPAIDTEPHYSPDGRYLLFTSGRGGTPQVYRLSLTDGAISRITYAGNYNAKASYLADQKHIVMLHREDKNFNIAVQDENGHVDALTSASLDESPSAAANGRLILYTTRHGERGVLAMVSSDGRIKLKLPARNGDIQEGVWSPYLK